MTRKRPPKKTESLEVRLSHGVKKAFMARARSRGRTASALVREFIDSYLADTDPRMENRRMLRKLTKPAMATSLVASAVALHLVAPTAASAAPDLKALFERLDRNHDGQLSAEEFVLREPEGILSAMQGVDLGNMMTLMIAHHSGVDHAVHGPLPEETVKRMREGFAHQDRDGDGTVSFGEFESAHLGALRQVFDMMDSDGDGNLDAAEFERMMGHLPSATAAHAKPFAEVDSDKSGAVSWTEFLG